jgi:hypothetical protein
MSAILQAQPDADGQAPQLLRWGDAMLRAFLEAAFFALCAIAVLLLLVLRRITDMLVTLIPLVVAALLTLEICAVTGFALIARVARYRCCFQDLLCDRVEARPDPLSGVGAHPRRIFQCAFDRGGVRQLVVLQQSGHFQHGPPSWASRAGRRITRLDIDAGSCGIGAARLSRRRSSWLRWSARAIADGVAAATRTDDSPDCAVIGGHTSPSRELKCGLLRRLV